MPDEELKVMQAATALGISIKAQVDQSREIVFQTHVALDVSVGELNAVLDKLSLAVDRQAAKVHAQHLKRDLALHEKQLRQMEEDFLNIEPAAKKMWENSGRKGEYKPKPNELAQRATAEANIRRWREEIAKLNVQVAEFEAKAK